MTCEHLGNVATIAEDLPAPLETYQAIAETLPQPTFVETALSAVTSTTQSIGGAIMNTMTTLYNVLTWVPTWALVSLALGIALIALSRKKSKVVNNVTVYRTNRPQFRKRT